MAIIFLGDVHGEFRSIASLIPQLGPEDTVIQVGDLGFWDSSLLRWPNPPFKVLAIDGNHEDFRMLRNLGMKEVRPNLVYVPRGTVLTIEGKRIGFLGGGESIDQAWRTEGRNWFPDERITEEDVQTLLTNVGETRHLDILVTHVPSTEFIGANFPPLNKAGYGLPPDWVDVSAQRVSEVLKQITVGQHFCGHMHESIFDGKTRLLAINETYTLFE